MATIDAQGNLHDGTGRFADKPSSMPAGALASRDSDKEVLERKRGAFMDGYTPDDIWRVNTQLEGIRLVCVWEGDEDDGDPYAGSSELLVDVQRDDGSWSGLHDPSHELHDHLFEGEGDSPWKSEGDWSSLLGAQRDEIEYPHDDGMGNVSLMTAAPM